MKPSLLDGLSEEQRGSVLRAARRRTFARREVVFHRGDPADTLHLVISGRFAAQIITPYGDTAVLSVAGPGDVFGELALLDDASRSATVIALEAAETRALRRSDFNALRAGHPEVAEILVRALTARVMRLSELLVDALYVPADRRVLRRIAELADTYEEAIPLTQEELAGLAGTSRATVNRVLRDAAGRGHVALTRGRVTVTDLDGLRARARLATPDGAASAAVERA